MLILAAKPSLEPLGNRYVISPLKQTLVADRGRLTGSYTVSDIHNPWVHLFPSAPTTTSVGPGAESIGHGALFDLFNTAFGPSSLFMFLTYSVPLTVK